MWWDSLPTPTLGWTDSLPTPTLGWTDPTPTLGWTDPTPTLGWTDSLPTLGWTDFFAFDLTEDGTYPKVRHDFRSPNSNFLHARQSFNFKKFQGA